MDSYHGTMQAMKQLELCLNTIMCLEQCISRAKYIYNTYFEVAVDLIGIPRPSISKIHSLNMNISSTFHIMQYDVTVIHTQ